MKLWKKLFRGVAKILLTNCNHCPCGGIGACEPKTLVSFTTSGDEDGNVYDLSAWKGEGKGAGGGHWRLLETTDCYVYSSGTISEKGELLGLPDKFVSTYHYMGHMLLQQGCEDEFGVIHWPPSCDN